MPRALITGITGQDGSYLAELLLDKGYEVHGVVRRSSTEYVRAHRAHPRPASRSPRPTSSTSCRSSPRSQRGRARRGLQPRRPVVRADLVEASRCSPASSPRSASRGCSRRSGSVDPKIRFYQASSSRDVRQGPSRRRRTRTRRSTRAARTASRRSTATASPSTTASRYGMYACSGILFNHESPRRGLEFVTRKVTDGVARIKLGLRRRAAARQPRRPARLGLRRRLRRGDVADAPAGRAGRLRRRAPARRTRSASSCDIAFAHAGLDWTQHVVADPALIPPGRGRPARRRRVEGARGARLGAEVDFEALVRMMVDADLERLGRSACKTRRPRVP